MVFQVPEDQRDIADMLVQLEEMVLMEHQELQELME